MTMSKLMGATALFLHYLTYNVTSFFRVSTVKYNRFHDQLLLSGSSDCTVHLWRVSSVSSAPLLEPEDDDMDSLDVNGHGDVGGFASGINGSKGEAADIRVRFLHSAVLARWKNLLRDYEQLNVAPYARSVFCHVYVSHHS